MPKRKRNDELIQQQQQQDESTVSEEKIDSPESSSSLSSNKCSTTITTTETNNPQSNNDGNNGGNNNFKSPLNPNDLIRRKSNRILSLKKLNHHQTTTSEDEQSSSSSAALSSTTTSSSSTNNNNCINNLPSSSSTTSSSNPNNFNDKTNHHQSSDVSNQTLKDSTSNTNKSMRKIQAWTQDDIRWFFEALCEHGKDFPHIQSYIQSRCEKKGIPTESIKTYEQVRHFYYRMWHKISQILNISSDVEKGIQEIYGLINYGELWKKFGSKFELKLNLNLQQLVDYGYTVVKIKGKTMRIKTPVCNALKKIHNINNKITKPITQSMPKEIIIELIPSTNLDWLHVHSLAQNPRLRTKLSMQQRLSTLISYLERRWNINRLHQNIYRLSMGEELNLNNSEDDNNGNDNRITTSSSSSSNYHLCLRPQKSSKLCDKITLKSTANSISYHNYRSTSYNSTTPIDLSLSAYMKNIMFNEENFLNNLKNRNNKINRKSNQKKPSTSSSSNQTTNDNKSTNGNKNNKDNNTIDAPQPPKDLEPQPMDVLKLLDSMNEELDETIQQPTQETNHNNNNNNETSLGSNTDSANNNHCEDNFLGEEQEQSTTTKLPEPPAHQTLAQWLAKDLDLEINNNQNNNNNNDVQMENESILEQKDESTTTNTTTSQQQQNSNKTQMVNNRKRRTSTSASDLINNNDTTNVDLLTAEKARLGWNRKNGETVTIGELYLLFCQPSKIILEYNWIENDSTDVDHHDATPKSNSDQTTESTTESSTTINDVEKKQSLCTLQKFLIAASVTLMNFKKCNNSNTNTNTNNNNNCGSVGVGGGSISNQSSLSSSSTTTTTSSAGRKRNNNNNGGNNSQLLSNLIQETILNDFRTGVDPNHQQIEPQPSSKTLDIGNISEDQLNPSSTTIKPIDDQTKVQEVLKELKIYGRQRRPLTKFILNNHHHQQHHPHNQSKMININPNGTKPAYLVIRAANLKSNTTATLPSTAVVEPINNGKPTTAAATALSLPQIVLTPTPTTTEVPGTISFKPNTSSSSESSVLIPVQLETKSNLLVPNHNNNTNVITTTTEIQMEQSSASPSTSSYLQLLPSTQPPQQIQSTNLINLQDSTTSHNLKDSKMETISLCSNYSSNNNNDNNNDTQTTTMLKLSLPSSSSSTLNLDPDPIQSTIPSSSSQMPWLNDISLGSLFSNCDTTNDATTTTITTQSKLINNNNQSQESSLLSINSLTPLPTFIETHLNTLANDNSIDLMAKFADLAEQIVSNDSIAK